MKVRVGFRAMLGFWFGDWIVESCVVVGSIEERWL